MIPEEFLDFLTTTKAQWLSNPIRLEGSVVLDKNTCALLNDWSKTGLIDDLINIEGSLRSRRVSNIPQSKHSKIATFEIITDHQNLKVYPSIETLAQERPVSPPKKFVIYNAIENYAYDESNKVEISGKLKHYLNITRIWNSLSKCAEDTKDRELVFLYRKKIRLIASYSTNILSCEFDGLEKFNRSLGELDEDSHKDAKKHLLQNTLVNMLNFVDEKDRFEFLLKNFTKFSIKFDDAYNAYVVGFSFDDLRKEYEERYREYMVKINDLISTSLIRSLMVPGALYLTATRTQSIYSSKSLTNALEFTLVNMGIGVASTLVCMIFWFILCNEKKSITSIELEFTSLMERLENKSPEALETIKEFRDNIKDRLALAKSAINLLCVGNIIAGILSVLWVLIRFIPNETILALLI